jgi:hypothetical protein
LCRETVFERPCGPNGRRRGNCHWSSGKNGDRSSLSPLEDGPASATGPFPVSLPGWSTRLASLQL